MAPDQKPTIYDVARQAGVSRQTVSRVINRHPDVAADTRYRILQIIDELNYRPSAIARSLSKQRSFNFGLLTAGLEYVGPSTTLSGMTKTAEALGYGLYLKELSSFKGDAIQPILDWFLSRQVDGILWAAPQIGENRAWIEDYKERVTVPMLFLTTARREDVSIVTVDNVLGARLAIEHLLRLGRQAIGHISGPMDWWESQQRFQGWQDTLTNAGFVPKDHMVAEGNWSSKSGKAAFEKLLTAFPEMDAVFVANDQMALSVLQSAQEKQLRIPEDLAVVGFDGIPESEYFTPPLTTVFQDLAQLGRTAVTALARIVEAKQSGAPAATPFYQRLEPHLIIRQSTFTAVDSA